METNKKILDACCGSRMFWFDKKEPHTLFCDIREYNKGFIDNRQNRELHPDKIMDFRKMDFPDKSFKLVVFDPPHLIGKPNGCRMTRTYGSLNAETWQDDIKKGFEECWRVLEDYGVLIFKWNDASKKRAELLKIIGKEPLFGHPNGSKIPTHWFCFMKFPTQQEEKAQELFKLPYVTQIKSTLEMLLKTKETSFSHPNLKKIGYPKNTFI
jgi:SAM-dependent methyltransferase